MDDTEWVALIDEVTRGKKVNLDSAVEDSTLDSLDMVEIIFALEEKGAVIPLDKLDTQGLKIAGNKTTLRELFSCVQFP